jgi:hypothetical protein
MQKSKNLLAPGGHATGLGLGGFMVIAQEVKNAVNKVEIKELEKFPTMLPGLTAGSFQGDYHVAQNLGLNFRERTSLQGQRDDIGGPPPLHDSMVKDCHGRVIYQSQAQFGIRTAQVF